MNDSTLNDTSADIKILSIDKLKHFDKLVKIRKEFTNKRTGETYFKKIQVRREEYKRGKHKGDVIEDPKHHHGTAMSDPIEQPPRRQRAPRPKPEGVERRVNRAGKEPIGQLKARKRRMGERQHRGNDIRNDMISNADEALENMFLMQEFQTPDEREKLKGTKYKNMVGFNKPDAEFFAEIMDQIFAHAGLARFRQALGSHGQAQVERQIQGRMLKYSKQLADIKNDNNRWRNFKTLKDMYKEAKGIRTDQVSQTISALRGIDQPNKNFDNQMQGVGRSARDNQINNMMQERRRGPKQKADGIAKRFDNAKHAAEVYYQVDEAVRNPGGFTLNDAIFNVLNKQQQMVQGGRDLDKLMMGGFGALDMKGRNKLKEYMKELAPEIADLFNVYKEKGISIPKGQAFRGKGIKEIQEAGIIARNPESRQIPQVRPRREGTPPERREGTPPESATEAPQQNLDLNQRLSDINKIFDEKVPKTIVKASDVKENGGGINGTYRFGKNNQRKPAMFYKPGAAEAHARNFIPTGKYYVREIAAYHIANEVGLAGLVPPTRLQEAKLDGDISHLPKLNRGINHGHGDRNNRFLGSAQMNAGEFGETVFGLKNCKDAADVIDRDLIAKTKNMTDLIALDFIQANTDRHAKNYWIGEDVDGNYQAIAIDNGLALPTRKQIDDQERFGNTMRTQAKAVRAGHRDTPLSKGVSDYIINFDENAANRLTQKLTNVGVEKSAIDGVVGRITDLQTVFKESGDRELTINHILDVCEKKYRYYVRGDFGMGARNQPIRNIQI